MPRSGEQGLFKALEIELRKSSEPLDCVQLFDRQTIREHAVSVNRVSDYLGNLWRKGLVVRLPAPKDTRHHARWMYQWKDRGKRAAPEGIPYIGPGTTLYEKPNMHITELGETVVIDLPQLTITIHKK